MKRRNDIAPFRPFLQELALCVASSFFGPAAQQLGQVLGERLTGRTPPPPSDPTT